MFENWIHFLNPAGWVGMLILGAWQFVTTKKERKLSQSKDSTAVTAADVENLKTIIATYDGFNKKLEDKFDKAQQRIGALESTLRKQALEHQVKLDEIDEQFRKKIVELDRQHREAMQEIESFYRVKCRDCHHEKTLSK